MTFSVIIILSRQDNSFRSRSLRPTLRVEGELISNHTCMYISNLYHFVFITDLPKIKNGSLPRNLTSFPNSIEQPALATPKQIIIYPTCQLPSLQVMKACSRAEQRCEEMIISICSMQHGEVAKALIRSF